MYQSYVVVIILMHVMYVPITLPRKKNAFVFCLGILNTSGFHIGGSPLWTFGVGVIYIRPPTYSYILKIRIPDF